MLTWFGTYVSKSFYSSCRSHWTFSLSSAVGLCRLMTIWSGISTPYRCCEIQWTDCPFKAIGMYYIAVLYTTIVVIKPLQGVVINVYGCWKGKLLMPAFLILLTIYTSIMHMITTCQCIFHISKSCCCLQTLCALLRAVFQKKLADMSFDVIDVLIGFDLAECQMRVGPCQLWHASMTTD